MLIPALAALAATTATGLGLRGVWQLSRALGTGQSGGAVRSSSPPQVPARRAPAPLRARIASWFLGATTPTTPAPRREVVVLRGDFDAGGRKKNFTDLPIRALSSWTVSSVRSALDQLELGSFQSAALMVDAMGRDDRVAGCLSARLLGLHGTPFSLEPHGDGRRAASVAFAAEEAWPDMVSQSSLEELERWGLQVGLGVGELIWDRSGGSWTPRLKIWHPQFVYWDWSLRAYRLITQDGVITLTPGDGKWVLYAPFGLQYAWLHGLVRSLGIPWLLRQLTYRDWARHSELHGMGLVKARVPAGASEDEKAAFEDALVNRGAEPVVLLPQPGKDTPGFDVNYLEAEADSYETFQKLIEKAENSIAIAILGQNLTTEVAQGSRAAAQVHGEVKRDIIAADAAELSRTLREQMLRPWAEYNFGDADLAPEPTWDIEPPADAQKTATALQQLSAALVGFDNAGAPVDIRAVLEQQGVPLITPEEEAERDAEAEERAAQAQAAREAQQPAQPLAPQQPPVPPKAQATKKLAAKKPRLTKGAKQGQAYADDLTVAARHAGAAALQDDLVKLRQVIDAATSADDLKRKLVEAFGEMKPAKLVKLVERAHVMAELAGRAAVLKDL